MATAFVAAQQPAMFDADHISFKGYTLDLLAADAPRQMTLATDFIPHVKTHEAAANQIWQQFSQLIRSNVRLRDELKAHSAYLAHGIQLLF